MLHFEGRKDKMRNLSVIIPSKTFMPNLLGCVNSIHEHEDSAKLIVIDDGLEASGYRPQSADYESGSCIDGASVLPGKKPFVFSRNVNLGIMAAGDDDVIVMNDDALLETPRGLTLMQREAYKHSQYGIVASTCNNVGNLNQHPLHTGEIRGESRMVCFVCVLILRSTINAIGLLDENYVDYGCEDDDYCLRARAAGLRIGVFDGCFVEHGAVKSTYRDIENRGDFRPNLRRFIAKWGHDNWQKTKETSDFPELFT
jgi:GT2 family glycosyltransferase